MAERQYQRAEALGIGPSEWHAVRQRSPQQIDAYLDALERASIDHSVSTSSDALEATAHAASPSACIPNSTGGPLTQASLNTSPPAAYDAAASSVNPLRFSAIQD